MNLQNMPEVKMGIVAVSLQRRNLRMSNRCRK